MWPSAVHLLLLLSIFFLNGASSFMDPSMLMSFLPAEVRTEYEQLPPELQAQLMSLILEAGTGKLSHEEIKRRLIPIAKKRPQVVYKFLKPEYTSQLGKIKS